MIDCIAGYHLNPWTCGIAKFNAILAKELDVPVVGLSSPDLRNYVRPLLSIKMSEFTPEDAQALAVWVEANVGTLRHLPARVRRHTVRAAAAAGGRARVLRQS